MALLFIDLYSYLSLWRITMAFNQIKNTLDVNMTTWQCNMAITSTPPAFDESFIIVAKEQTIN